MRQKIRIAFSTVLRKLRLWKYLGLPKSIMSIREYNERYCATYSPQLISIFPEVFHRETPPSTLNDQISWKFINLYGRNLPEAFVFRVPFGRVYGSKGAVITQDGVLLRDVSREFGRRHLHSTFEKWKIAPPQKLSGNVAVLVTDGGNTYYHWMFDILPRLYLLQEANVYSDIEYFILPKISHPYQEQSLSYLNIDRSKIIEASVDCFHIEAKNLFIPSLPSLLGTVNQWACTYLQRSFPLNQLPEVTTGKKIFISRRKAGNRRLLNEDEIANILVPAGFDIVEAEQYSLLQQIAIFQKAEVVVAPHGSGLSNIVFCKPGTIIIDLFSVDFVVPCFWIIANNCSLKYYFLFDKETDAEPYAPYWESKGKDIIFPTEKLKQLLQKLNTI